jgi:hypothetical protein
MVISWEKVAFLATVSRLVNEGGFKKPPSLCFLESQLLRKAAATDK